MSKPRTPGWREHLQSAPTLLLVLLAGATAVIGRAAYGARHSFSNLDAVSYMTIADHYARGLFEQAVNGYWSPVTSWLMVPLIKLGADGQLAFVIINALAAIFVLSAGLWLVWRQTKGNLVACLLFWLIAAPFLAVSVAQMTPDLLVIAWTLIFLAALLQADSWLNRKQLAFDVRAGLLLGVVGALGYLVKLYLLPFFVVSVALWTLWRVLAYRHKLRRFQPVEAAKRWLRAPAITALVLALGMAPWAYLLSRKYDRPTIGSSAAVNLATKFEAPTTSTAPAQQSDEPVRLNKPPHAYAIDFREDRTPRNVKRDTVSVKGAKGLKYYVSERFKAFPHYVRKVSSIWLFTLPVVVLVAVAALTRRLKYTDDRELLLTGTLFAVYFAGYAAITSASSGGGNVRYYWPLFIYALLMAAWGWPHLWSVARMGWQRLVLLALAGLMIVLPGTSYLSELPGLLKNPKPSTLSQTASALRRDGIIQDGDDIASNNNRQALYFSYYARTQNYKIAGSEFEPADPQVAAAMEEYDIEQFIYFAPADAATPMVAPGSRVVREFELGRFPCADLRSAPLVACKLYVIDLPD